MSGFVFNQLEIYNFKYVTYDRPIKVKYSGSNIVILDGQNGYGKTTLFDAIELLLTGGLKHFNSKLLNKGTETIRVLANDNGKDIIIIGELRCEKNVVVLKRIFCAQNGFESKILWNNEEINQDEVYKRLNFSAGLFDLGTYISQSESLTFLQNKYKDRKDRVSSLLQDQDISTKISLLKTIRGNLEDRLKRESELIDGKEKAAKTELDKLSDELKAISISDGVAFYRLFPEKHFDFDEENIKTDKTYLQFIKPLDNLEYFIKNYKEYEKYVFNLNVNKAINTSPQVYMAYYYRSELKDLDKNRNLINILLQCRKLSQQFSKGDFGVESDKLGEIGIKQDTIEKLGILNKSKQTTQNSLNATNKTLIGLNDARLKLFRQYKSLVDSKELKDNTCPFCGSPLDSVEDSYKKSEEILTKAQDTISKQVLELNHQIENICKQDIEPFINILLSKNVELLKIHDALNQFVNLSTTELEDLLSSIGINNFSALKEVCFNSDNFTKDFDNLKLLIEEKRKAISVFLSDEEIEMFKNIHFEYYKNLEPRHTVEQIKQKKQYIAYAFLHQIMQIKRRCFRFTETTT